MAETLHDDHEERNRRVEKVGNEFLNTGYSTRRLAKLLSQNDFKISNATVSDYLQRYKTVHPDKADQIDSLIEANKGSSLKNIDVINRVYKVSELILNNHSFEEIAELFDETYWTIYYDSNIRLAKIDPKLYEEIKKTLENR